MNRFYGSMAYVGCGNGCNSKLQKLLFNEVGQPIDMDWEGLQQIYNEHTLNCSVEAPYTDDINAFYDDPANCTGFIVDGNPDSGYRYCEF